MSTPTPIGDIVTDLVTEVLQDGTITAADSVAVEKALRRILLELVTTGVPVVGKLVEAEVKKSSFCCCSRTRPPPPPVVIPLPKSPVPEATAAQS